METISVRAAANTFEEFEQLLISAVAAGGLTTIGISGSFDFPRTIELNSTNANVNIVLQPADGTVLGVEGFFRHFAITASGNFIFELKGTVLDGRQIGGGIHFTGSNLALFSGPIVNCVAENGGGLFVDGSAVIEAMQFNGNTCHPLAGDDNTNTGGAIYVQNGELLLFAETVIEHNGSLQVKSGGGVYAAAGCTVDIRLAVIQFNEAQSGGGITLEDRCTLKHGGYIQSNTAIFGGGGIYGAYTTESTSGIITQTSYLNINGHVKDNVAERTSGGIYGGVVTVGRGGFVSRNRVTGPGSEAGILCARFIMEESGIVSNNVLEQPATGYMPGVGVKCTSALINGGTISGNTYLSETGFNTGGGGIYCEPRLEGDTIIINEGTISGNKAHTGGGVFMFATSSARYTTPPVLQINGGEITGNEAVSGGGVYAYGFDIEMTGGEISGNRYSTYGGGIYSIGERLTVSDAVIDANKPSVTEGTLYGGGIYVNFYNENSACFVNISGSTSIEHNEGTNGGGIYMGVTRTQPAGNLSVSGNVSVAENIVSGNGGGMFLSNVTGELSGPLEIRKNSAANGGGIAVNRSVIDLDGSDGSLLLEGNAANNGGGIYAYNENTKVRLVSSVSVTENNAAENGGAIWVDELAKLSVQTATVTFTDNLAEKGFQMTDPTDIALHESLIRSSTFSQPFQYAYNNYDVVYLEGDLLVDNFTVTFETNGGSYIPPQSVAAGGHAEEPDTPSRPDYRFTGWYQDTVLQDPWDFNRNTVSGDTTLYAAWEEEILPTEYAVTYNANGGTGHFSQTVSTDEYEVLSIFLTGISRAGYSFTEWNTAPDSSGTPYSPGNTIILTGDLILYAQWTAISEILFSVTYEANGGIGGLVQPGVPAGNLYTVRTPGDTGISRGGYVFTDWNTESGGSGISYIPGSTITITGNVVLYAQWAEAPPKPPIPPVPPVPPRPEPCCCPCCGQCWCLSCCPCCGKSCWRRC